jgi:hypothetical protein
MARLTLWHRTNRAAAQDIALPHKAVPVSKSESGAVPERGSIAVLGLCMRLDMLAAGDPMSAFGGKADIRDACSNVCF